MPVRRAVLISLIASTVIWLIVLVPVTVGSAPELSFTTDDSGLLEAFQWLRVLGQILLPFTIFLSVIAMWLLFALRFYRGAVMAAILPLFSLLVYSIGASGMAILGA